MRAERTKRQIKTRAEPELHRRGQQQLASRAARLGLRQRTFALDVARQRLGAVAGAIHHRNQ
ncbi:MAG: hypothetical protein ACYC97_10820 [Metallibacterium sp.]